MNRIIRMLLHHILDHVKEGPIQTRFGFLIHFKGSGYQATSIRKDVIPGIYESSCLPMIKRLIHHGDHVVDVGAHEGYISLFMSQLVGQMGRVYSFEPNQENLDFLRRNIRLNSITNIEVFEMALSDKKAKMTLYYDSDMGAWGSLIHFPHFKTKKTVKCDVDTLDHLFEHREKIGFIKIDTEGNELNVLIGAKRILCEDNPHIMFEVNLTFWAQLGYSIDTLFNLLTGYGYELFVVKHNKLHPYEWLDNRVFDMFAIHKSRKNLI